MRRVRTNNKHNYPQQSSESLARAMARKFRVVLQPDGERVRARVAEFPGLIVDAGSPEEALSQALFAIQITIEEMLAKNTKVPTPDDPARNQQINIRVSVAEKESLQEKAERGGFRGLSDYVRAIALSEH